MATEEPIALDKQDNAVAETHPEGTCSMCHKPSKNMRMCEVSYPYSWSQRSICGECKDRVSVTVMKALASIGW